jgi:adenine-specific DNA-methyltransferase
MTRAQDFAKIHKAISNYVKFSIPNGLLIQGDSLEILKKFPDRSVSLIFTDPPYHTTKKRNIYGDTSFKEDKHYLEWMAQYAVEWKRILRPNGSFFCFCSTSMAARLEVLFSEKFNVLSQIVWTKPNDPGFDGWKQKMKKEALRQWYNHSERIIFAEPAVNGNLNRSYFGNLLRECRKKAGLTMNKLTGIIGAYGKINHGGAVSNWEAGRNVPSEEQYEKIRTAILKSGKVESMLEYRDLIRPFIIDGTKEFTDVWNFPTIRPYDGKHPAEKPISLLTHAIEATTFQGDIVLDCFGGSGTTAIAALKLGRYAISIEIDPVWVKKTVQLLKSIEKKQYKEFPDNYKAKETMITTPTPQGNLFNL